MKTALFGVAAWLLAISTASADVQLTMQSGRVSLVAKDATVRQILTEWARVGQTKIVNVERVPGVPVTLELVNVPEAQALEVLLRSLSGYITAPRPVDAANLSRFDRIIIMPTLAAARPATASTPAPAVFQQGSQFNLQPLADDEGDDERPASAAVGSNRQGFTAYPQPRVLNPETVPVSQPGMPTSVATPQMPAPTAPATYPGAPAAPYGGVSVPGMVAPPPPTPPGQPAPGQPVRRPGGPGGQ